MSSIKIKNKSPVVPVALWATGAWRADVYGRSLRPRGSMLVCNGQRKKHDLEEPFWNHKSDRWIPIPALCTKVKWNLPMTTILQSDLQSTNSIMDNSRRDQWLGAQKEKKKKVNQMENQYEIVHN